MTKPSIHALAILVMRVSLGAFLLLWSLEKFVAPSSTIRIAAHFYGIGLPASVTPLIGLAELALSLALIVGFARRLVYGIAAVIHGISTLATWHQLLDPFHNHLYIAGVPVLGAFVALYLLRDLDICSLESWLKTRKTSPRLQVS